MTGAELWIANTIGDLIQGDVREHLPLERIPLNGDVLGMGTSTSIDNGELAFLEKPDGTTTIWKCQASDGGHLHHEHEGTALLEVERLVLYPMQRLHQLASDLAIESLRFEGDEVQFVVANRGDMDVSDVGVAVVIDNAYNTHRYLRLPWLAAGASQAFSMDLALIPGPHRIEVIADPEKHILEESNLQANNAKALDLVIPG